jgi:hypothetical protein
MFILFDELNQQAATAEVESSVSPGGHGAAFFVLSALWRLPQSRLLAVRPLSRWRAPAPGAAVHALRRGG